MAIAGIAIGSRHDGELAAAVPLQSRLCLDWTHICGKRALFVGPKGMFDG